MGATAEALNYDYDDVEIISTPKVNTEDKIVRCYTESELTDELANMLKDSLKGVHKANLENSGLEIRKRNRELIIREKKKAKLLSMVELGFMTAVMALCPLLMGLYMGDLAIYGKLYIVTAPVAAYFVRELKNL